MMIIFRFRTLLTLSQNSTTTKLTSIRLLRATSMPRKICKPAVGEWAVESKANNDSTVIQPVYPRMASVVHPVIRAIL